jgi:hypothetical protein
MVTLKWKDHLQFFPWVTPCCDTPGTKNSEEDMCANTQAVISFLKAPCQIWHKIISMAIHDRSLLLSLRDKEIFARREIAFKGGRGQTDVLKMALLSISDRWEYLLHP